MAPHEFPQQECNNVNHKESTGGGDQFFNPFVSHPSRPLQLHHLQVRKWAGTPSWPCPSPCHSAWFAPSSTKTTSMLRFHGNNHRVDHGNHPTRVILGRRRDLEGSVLQRLVRKTRSLTWYDRGGALLLPPRHTIVWIECAGYELACKTKARLRRGRARGGRRQRRRGTMLLQWTKKKRQRERETFSHVQGGKDKKKQKVNSPSGSLTLEAP